jgi:uncharacterized protein (DUF2062 family)
VKRLKEKILEFLRQGMTPRELALAISLGITLGTFPVVGATSILCGLAGVVLGLNLPIIQSVNWAVSPLQLSLLIPFFGLGSVLFGGKQVSVSLAMLVSMMQSDPVGTIGRFLIVTLHAIGAWTLVAPPVAVIVYVLVLPLISRLQRQYVRVHSDDDRS